MIQVFGAEGTREYEAALELRDIVVRHWPEIATSQGQDLKIVAGAKCHGQRIRDVDIILLGTFTPGLVFNPFLPIPMTGDRWTIPSAMDVRSLCVAIEVKDHDPSRVSFVGTSANVLYKDGWKNATEQNEAQVYSIKGYLESQGVPAPHITSLLWLRNIPNDQLPRRPHSILGSPTTCETLLSVLAQVSPPRWIDRRWVLSAGERSPADFSRAAELFTKQITPTRLDRRRMERITQKSIVLEPIRKLLGQKLVILRGRSGTGKTAHLLQLAYRLSIEEDARVLLLTYNRALVADIRRLLTILGIGDDIVGRTIQIQTVHSFLYGALRGLGVVDDATDFLRNYDELKGEGLALLRAGALTQNDVEQLAVRDSEAFRWDYLLIDEGQDWPPNERDLLFEMYGASRIAVADGVDQLVRSSGPIDWHAGLQRASYQVIPLTVSLRMKAGLARFASSMAKHLGLLTAEWKVNDEIPGGRVVIVDGSYLANRGLHDRLLDENTQAGNQPVDMLFCVPPSLVSHLADGSSHSGPAERFTDWGRHVWDGVSADIREGYPTELDQLRIVQYESCRGLEGWTSVNLALDDFYAHKVLAFGNYLSGAAVQPIEDPQAAHIYASRWVMIPLTRAIDTVVVEIGPDSSPFRQALEAAAEECNDYVEWVTAS